MEIERKMLNQELIQDKSQKKGNGTDSKERKAQEVRQWLEENEIDYDLDNFVCEIK